MMRAVVVRKKLKQRRMARVMSLNSPAGKGAWSRGKNGLFLLSTLHPDLVVPKLFPCGSLFNINNIKDFLC